MDTIEFEDPKYSQCPCCDAKITTLVRFVERDGTAFAVYWAKFSDGPQHTDVHILVGFGDWTEDAPEERRTAFAFKIWPGETEFCTTMVGAEEGQWKTTFLGQILSREEALAHQWLPEVFDLSDHIVRCDDPIKKFLDEACPQT